MLTEAAKEWLIDDVVPSLLESLATIAKELKRANDLKEKGKPKTDAERVAEYEQLAPVVLRGKYAEMQLEAAFNSVKGASWKDPIDKEIDGTDEGIELIRFAVQYCHGVEPELEAVDKQVWRIKSPGYLGGM